MRRGCAFAAALAGALVLALLARAVLDVRDPASGRRESGLLAPLAAGLVGGHGDSRPAQIVQELGDMRGGRPAVLHRHELARRALAELAQNGRGSDRAWAANVLGVLDIQDTALLPAQGSRLAASALRAFQGAVRAPGATEDAKFNLELLLTLAHSQRDERRHGGARGTRPQVPAPSAQAQQRHAGQNPPGSGF